MTLLGKSATRTSHAAACPQGATTWSWQALGCLPTLPFHHAAALLLQFTAHPGLVRPQGICHFELAGVGFIAYTPLPVCVPRRGWAVLSDPQAAPADWRELTRVSEAAYALSAEMSSCNF
mmetsp:Transcript_3423/g.9555  ORF Transcript_3423/g.9555 Transcript_3423/m.9555 type:complete len:120 (+) Transcript_3423:927-1286(+)